jgi:dihydrofolate reductase
VRKIIYLVHTSVDGFIEGPQGEFDWPMMGPELSSYIREFDDRTDLFLYGRVVWGWMANFWPKAEELSDDPHVRSFAPVWRRTPKAVVSRTLPEPAGDDVTILRGDDLAAEVTALKTAPGKDILLIGGTELASRLAALGLIDEYFICVHPVVLGGGRRLFLHQEERVTLDLAEVRTADGRVVVLRYVKP